MYLAENCWQELNLVVRYQITSASILVELKLVV